MWADVDTWQEKKIAKEKLEELENEEKKKEEQLKLREQLPEEMSQKP